MTHSELTALVVRLEATADKATRGVAYGIEQTIWSEAAAAIRALAGEVERVEAVANRLRISWREDCAKLQKTVSGYEVELATTRESLNDACTLMNGVRAERDSLRVKVNALSDENDTLRAEVAALRKDAERWRSATGAYDLVATCKHGDHPYRCILGCDPFAIDAALEREGSV